MAIKYTEESNNINKQNKTKKFALFFSDFIILNNAMIIIIPYNDNYIQLMINLVYEDRGYIGLVILLF